MPARKTHKRRQFRRRRTQRGGSSNTLRISYEGRNINSIKNSKNAYTATRKDPQISLHIPDNKMYTLVMFDPDAPAPGFLHWFFINMESDIPYKPAFAYYPPEPPSGAHQYQFILYEQPTRLVDGLPASAGPFDLAAFVKTKGLKQVGSKSLLVSKSK